MYQSMRYVSVPLLTLRFNIHPALQDNPRSGRRLASGAVFLWLPVLAAILLISLGGCSQTTPPPSVRPSSTRMARWIRQFEDPSTRYPEKVRLDRRIAGVLGTSAPARLAALVFDICGYGQSVRTKIYCLRSLGRADRSLAIDLIVDRLPQTNHWAVLKTEIGLVMDGRRPSRGRSVEGALIQSLARRSKRYSVLHRPETLALQKLNHADLHQILIQRFETRGDMASRLAAMKILERWRGLEYLLQRIRAYRGDDPLMSMLHRYAVDFAFVSRTATQIMWIEEWCLRFPPGTARRLHRMFLKLRSWQPSVSPLQLVWLERLADRPHQPLMNPSTLRQRIIMVASQHRHVKRPPWYPGAPDDVHSAAQHSVPHLSYLDLCVLRYLQRALASKWFDRKIWRQGRRAALDRTAEPGGILAFPKVSSAVGSTRPQLIFISSARKQGEGIYVAGARVLQMAPGAVCQFIFHFQHTDNARYCGPAVGDLQYARRTASVVLIFTSIASHQFDATVDFPPGVVVDLGVWKCN